MKLSLLRPLIVLSAAALTLSATAPAFGVSGGGQGTKTSSNSDLFSKADAVYANLGRVDLLGKMIPLALTRDQIRALLPAIERARAKELEIRKLDAQEIVKLEAEATKSVDEAIEKNVYPSQDFQKNIVVVTRAIALRRSIALGEMVDIVFESAKKTLDIGQMKVMANTLKPELTDEMAKGSEMTDEQKQKFFIRYILLDNLAYDILIRMSKNP